MDAVLESDASCVEHKDAEHVGAQWVEVPEAAVGEVNQKGGDQHADGVDDVAEDVQIGGLDVEVAFGSVGLFQGGVQGRVRF